MSVKIVLLCEDVQQACFARRFLKQRGWTARQIREEIAPPGRGSGEQWVRERFPDELQAMRKRRNVALAVLTDADTLSVAERVASLARSCDERETPRQSAQEPVLMMIPKRNIETWFAYLRGETVNEDDVYPRYGQESECRDDVKVLDRMCKDGQLRVPNPPSLRLACGEFAKLQ